MGGSCQAPGRFVIQALWIGAYGLRQPLPSVPSVPDAAWGQQINDNFAFLAEDRAALAGFQEDRFNVPDDDPTALDDAPVTITDEGLYLVTANIGSTAATGGSSRRYVSVTGNGNDIARRQGASSLAGTYYSTVTALARLDAGDELGVVVYQNAGVTMSFYGRLTALLVAP